MSAGIKFHRISEFLDSSSSQHKLPHINSHAVKDALKEIGFKVPFKPSFAISTDFDIPYLCGYDTKKDLAYFDKDFTPLFNESLKAQDTLLTHEEIEKKLESFPENWNYQQRHHIATHCERLCVEHLGWDWAAYSRWTTHSWHSSYAKWKGTVAKLHCPPTLDMSPYLDEDDKLISLMKKAGAKDEGKES